MSWRHGTETHTSVTCIQSMFSFSPPPLLAAEFSYSNMCSHKSLQTLKEHVDLEHQCGYITMLNSNNRHRRRPSDSAECSGV